MNIKLYHSIVLRYGFFQRHHSRHCNFADHVLGCTVESSSASSALLLYQPARDKLTGSAAVKCAGLSIVWLLVPFDLPPLFFQDAIVSVAAAAAC